MSTLKDILCTPEKRPRVVSDAVRLVDDEVAAKSGLSGMAIKAGYKVVKAVKPGLIQEAVDGLLDKFIERLEPFFTDWNAKGKSPGFGAYLGSRQREVANALLGVTDDRAKNVQNSTIRGTYTKLRPQGEKNVEAAVPGLGRLLDRHVS